MLKCFSQHTIIFVVYLPLQFFPLKDHLSHLPLKIIISTGYMTIFPTSEGNIFRTGEYNFGNQYASFKQTCACGSRQKKSTQEKNSYKKILEIVLHFHTPMVGKLCISGAQLNHDFWKNWGVGKNKQDSCCIVSYGSYYIFNTPN